MNILEETRDLCKIYNIKPTRSKGQNFLINEDVYDKIIETADLSADDIVLEVGPGLGFLTQRLAQKVKRVIAIELDDKLAEVLRERLEVLEIKNVEVINENVLDVKAENLGLKEGGYKIVANLPYNITSVFLRKFLSEQSQKPKYIVLMLQKEVVKRIIAQPPKMSLLAISIQFYAKGQLVEYVSKENFFPSPEVDSAVIKIITSKQKKDINEKDFFRLVKFGFSSKRKMLKNNLSSGYHIDQSEVVQKIKEAGFNEKVRAQELSVDDWKKLLPYFL